MDREKLGELFCQAVEAEQRDARVYDAALEAAVDEGLKAEWALYREQTEEHLGLLEDVVRRFGFDPRRTTPGSEVVRLKGEALVKAIAKARAAASSPAAAQLAAAECVIDAESKAHLNWELLGEAVGQLEGEEAEVLQEAFDKVEEEEDEHLYHAMGWCRELWLEFLGLPAVLPPPERSAGLRPNASRAS